MKGYILFFIAVILSFKLCHSVNQCPNTNAVTGFNSLSFSGSWYRFYKTPTSLYANKNCTQVNFVVSSTNNAIISTMVDTYWDAAYQTKQETVNIVMPSGSDVGYMVGTYPSGAVVKMHVVFVPTSYALSSLALIIGCSENPSGIERHAWILSKHLGFALQHLESVYVKLRENGFNCNDLVSSYDWNQCTLLPTQ